MSDFSVRLACASASCLLLTACADRAPIAAAPSIVVSPDRVPIGGTLDVTLQFHVGADAPRPAPEGRVLLRVLFDGGELMRSYDHVPPKPTNEWGPGTTVQYTQRIVLPDVAYVGDASIVLGLESGATHEPMRLGAPKDSAIGGGLYKLATIVITGR